MLENTQEVQEIKAEMPDLETMQQWVWDGVAEATDGCIVEPDGTCEHGCQSWLLVLGVI